MHRPVLLLIGIFLVKQSYCQNHTDVVIVIKDSVTVAASRKYAATSLHRRLLMGKNYRSTWSRPVKLPVLYLSDTGFTVDTLGGSKQTNSLYLRDKNGRSWVLRSVDKDVKKGIPGLLRATPFTGYKEEQISAAYPYAALLASKLARSTGIIASEPVYVYVGEDAALGKFQGLFAHTVCMLEILDPTPDHSKTLKTDSLPPGAKVLQIELLKARLLDMLMGDWDRHEGQWRWGVKDSAGVNYYYPIPRDRDFSFFYTKGFIPMLSRLSFEPFLTGFNAQARGLTKLNRKAVSLDRKFLNELNRRDWETITLAFQQAVTDEVILEAVNALPPEIASIDGNRLRQKLQSRRDRLMEGVMGYYEYLFGNNGSVSRKAAGMKTSPGLP